MSISSKDKAIELRKLGWSLPQIVKELNSSKSTVYYWIKDVDLNFEQQKILNEKKLESKKNNRIKASKCWSDKHKEKRLQYQIEGFELAKEKNSIELAICCILYWAEGSKCKNAVQFTNMDVDMCKIFVNCMKKFFSVKNEEFALTFHYHEDSEKTEDEIFHYWIENLNLKNCRQTKPYKKEKLSSKTKSCYGIVRISLYNTKVINTIWGAIQYYCNSYPSIDNKFLSYV